MREERLFENENSFVQTKAPRLRFEMTGNRIQTNESHFRK